MKNEETISSHAGHWLAADYHRSAGDHCQTTVFQHNNNYDAKADVADKTNTYMNTVFGINICRRTLL